ncbi:hypothetical protein UFOVP213_27 [uncultured Caudovirales phage]|uniref:Uncharacterized protein n=1 Tax=uncultured Caudovirales phage TaxID=2100421 RepID=A0A6J7WR05_9CAUD|nr:hypothetical protein UFOVP213_27 [uncultured Caudovirales phage]
MKIKVIYKKLGREQAHGIAESDGIIYIDPRLRGRKEMEILIHEAYHLLQPEAEEDEVIEKSVTLTKLLWRLGYRKVDNSKHLPLQDGSK